jgi:anti-sigma-K factor RskA
MTECPQTPDAGAWVLGALPAEEAAAYALHLRDCERCAGEVARLQTVADVLPMAAVQVDPPRELRGRVMAAVREEAAREEAARGGAQAHRRALVGRGWSARQDGLARLGELVRRRRWQSVAALAAACAAVAVGVAVGLGGGGGSGGARTVPAQVTVRGSAGWLVIDRGRARLHVARLPVTPPGRVYEVWLQRPGRAPEATHALFRVGRDGAATVDVPGGVAGVQRVMVTAEPAGGSEAPTSAPIVVAQPA